MFDTKRISCEEYMVGLNYYLRDTVSSTSGSHICVCIPTYKRLQMLKGLLTKLQGQRTDGLFTYSVLVVDNDSNLSARDLVMEIRERALIHINYCVAEEKNVAVARNVAVQNAIGELIAFIDDDETPVDDWLLNLFKVYKAYKVDGVLGPVKPVFGKPPPDWVVKAKLFERPSYETGLILRWDCTRTGNVLLRRNIFDESDNLFNPEFKHSEDRDFFRRIIRKGFIFVWCDEAPVYETEMPERFKIKYFLKRALVRGNASMRHRRFSKASIMKSAIAILVYTSALPFLFLIGQHLFILYMIKLFDHIGALMAVFKFDLVNYFGGA
ncbi:MAG: glycosyltransferase family 2 protein [Thermodesulfobacteriota bacterium]